MESPCRLRRAALDNALFYGIAARFATPKVGLQRSPWPANFSTISATEVHVTPDCEKQFNDLAAQSRRTPDELLEDALAGYFSELAQTRETLNSRYDEFEEW